MEIIILVSIGVIIGTLVVVFKKLNSKVNIQEAENIRQDLKNIFTNSSEKIDKLENNYDHALNDIYILIDNFAKKIDDQDQSLRNELANIPSGIDGKDGLDGQDGADSIFFGTEDEDIEESEKKIIKSVENLRGSDLVEVIEVDTSYNPFAT